MPNVCPVEVDISANKVYGNWWSNVRPKWGQPSE